MAIFEERAKRNGVSLPIQCIHMRQTQCKGAIRHHYHDYTELLFGISGCVSVYIGSRHYFLREGDMAIIHTHEPHDVKGTGVESHYTVVKFLPQVLLAGEQTYQEYGYALALMENTQSKQAFFGKEELAGSDIKDLFTHIMEEWNAQAFGHELSLRADVTRIFLHILRTWHKNNMMPAIEPSGEHYRIMQTAVSYIANNYTDLTEDDVAAACGMSRSYFSRTFSRAMQIGFSSYVTGVRLREAERLLLTTDQSMTEIAEAVGYTSDASFRRAFKKITGVSPLEYREN